MKSNSRAKAATYILTTGLIISGLSGLCVGQGQNSAQRPETQQLIPSLDGATLFVTYCAVCHGKAADGRGPMASILKTPVPNLTEIAKRNRGTFSLERVEATIAGTEESGLGHGTREMPIWGPIFSQVTTDQDFGKVRIYNLAKYLESIQKK